MTSPVRTLVAAGIEDLKRGEFTIEALLVAVGARRLRAAGLPMCPRRLDGRPVPEHALYDAIGRSGVGNSHARYNSLIRRLVSFERALERRSQRQP